MDWRHSLTIRSFRLYHLTVGALQRKSNAGCFPLAPADLCWTCLYFSLCHDLTWASLISGFQLGLPMEHSVRYWKAEEKIHGVFLPSVLSWWDWDFVFVFLHTKATAPAWQTLRQSNGNTSLSLPFQARVCNGFLLLWGLGSFTLCISLLSPVQIFVNCSFIH